MRRKPLLLLAAIAALAVHAVPHGHEHGHEHIGVTSPDHPSSTEASPSNVTQENARPTISYITPADDKKGSHSDMHTNMGGMGHSTHGGPVVDGPIPPEKMSYWLWPEHRGFLYAHIIIMTLSWGFILPLGAFIPCLALTGRGHAWSGAICLPYPSSNSLSDVYNSGSHPRHHVQLSHPGLL